MLPLIVLLPYLTADVTLIRQMGKRTSSILCGVLKKNGCLLCASLPGTCALSLVTTFVLS